ncbi:C40 family peptidase [Psychromonas sp. SR45-3]|uniref:C40 family peptidase n=1 Tax=Psychromonas sp. SR45-3 TaxID=2760930 RepID=UPI0015FAF688|nr:NlpC/P60 family protein [Psychromonas sp. SR45-3]MBB1272239.1 C40 family peptidase [Psychromonas sp. SR45-3]
MLWVLKHHNIQLRSDLKSRLISKLSCKLSYQLSLLPLLCLLAACSSKPDHQDNTSISTNTSSAITSSSNTTSAAMQTGDLLYLLLLNEHEYWEGSPYRYGGNSLHGIDCSSLVQKVFKNSFNIQLPRTTEYQVRKGFSIKKSQLKVGDLVFFKTGRSSRHVGIYMGEGEFFHVSTSKGVKISKLSNPYWRKHYWQSRRVIH